MAYTGAPPDRTKKPKPAKGSAPGRKPTKPTTVKPSKTVIPSFSGIAPTPKPLAGQVEDLYRPALDALERSRTEAASVRDAGQRNAAAYTAWLDERRNAEQTGVKTALGDATKARNDAVQASRDRMNTALQDAITRVAGNKDILHAAGFDTQADIAKDTVTGGDAAAKRTDDLAAVLIGQGEGEQRVDAARGANMAALANAQYNARQKELDTQTGSIQQSKVQSLLSAYSADTQARQAAKEFAWKQEQDKWNRKYLSGKTAGEQAIGMEKVKTERIKVINGATAAAERNRILDLATQQNWTVAQAKQALATSMAQWKVDDATAGRQHDIFMAKLNARLNPKNPIGATDLAPKGQKALDTFVNSVVPKEFANVEEYAAKHRTEAGRIAHRAIENIHAQFPRLTRQQVTDLMVSKFPFLIHTVPTVTKQGGKPVLVNGKPVINQPGDLDYNIRLQIHNKFRGPDPG